MNVLCMRKLEEIDNIWEEERVFLFIDMNNSTYLAERLGNKLFSYLITQFVADIYPLIQLYKAELYQVVGDEIVLTWIRRDYGTGACVVNLFFDFQQKVALRGEYYVEKFGHVPCFKAIAHLGSVAVSVDDFFAHGPIYRGNVLNTCGGLLHLCKQLETPLIVTEEFALSVSTSSSFVTRPLGSFLVKGKRRFEKIFGIEKTVAFCQEIY